MSERKIKFVINGIVKDFLSISPELPLSKIRTQLSNIISDDMVFMSEIYPVDKEIEHKFTVNDILDGKKNDVLLIQKFQEPKPVKASKMQEIKQETIQELNRAFPLNAAEEKEEKSSEKKEEKKAETINEKDRYEILRKFNKKFHYDFVEEQEKIEAEDIGNAGFKDLCIVNFSCLKELSVYVGLTVITPLVNAKFNETLTELRISKNNELEDVSCLAQVNFPNLKILDLFWNKIKDISFLKNSKFPLLETLNVGGNFIEKIDVLKEVNFPELKKLFLNKNQIKDFTPLTSAKFLKLEEISISSNEITDISFLEKCNFPKLVELMFVNNNVKDISVLSKVKFPELKRLLMYLNKIEDISVLKNCNFKNLEEINIGYCEHFDMCRCEDSKVVKNQVSDVSILTECSFPKLKKLDMSHCLITKIPVLLDKNYLALEEIKFNANKIIDISEMSKWDLKKLKQVGLKKNVFPGTKENVDGYLALQQKNVEIFNEKPGEVKNVIPNEKLPVDDEIINTLKIFHNHPMYLAKGEAKECKFCFKDKEDYYKCDSCELIMCVGCAKKIRGVKSFSEHQHPLKIIPRSGYRCDACNYGRGRDFSFCCSLCNYDVCLQCVSIIDSDQKDEEIINGLKKFHDDPFDFHSGQNSYCFFCSKSKSNIYICKCDLRICVNCATKISKANYTKHNHPLKLVKVGNWRCDGCKSHCGSVWSFRCVSCGYDACINCLTE